MGFNLFGKKKAATTSTEDARKHGAGPAVVEHSVEHSAGELERVGADSAEPEAAPSVRAGQGHAASASMERAGSHEPQGQSSQPAASPPSSAAENRADGSVDAPASAASAGPGATPSAAGTAAVTSGKDIGPDQLEEFVVDALRGVYDPEIPVNIYDLGLIYDLRVEEGGKVTIKMTLTAPACPVAGEMPGMVEMAARQVEGVTACDVELVWEPAWNPDMMSEAARLQLNI